MTTFTYFAYGSNMATRRLRARTPSAQVLGVGYLDGWSLNFHKRALDDSGKCSIVHTGGVGERVYGVVFTIACTEQEALDRAEGLGVAYLAQAVAVQREKDGVTQTVPAMAYVACALDATAVPYHWYKEFVWAGAVEHGLPPDYIARIQAVVSQDDPDLERQRMNSAILGLPLQGKAGSKESL